MKETVLDLHIHSKYSRACSKNLVLPAIAKACEVRGISIVATGDFTHPAWFSHIQEQLIESQPGIFILKDGSSKTQFILGTEVSSIKKHAGQTRRVHHLLFSPSMDSVHRFNAALESRGCNIRADGRPILGLTSKELLELLLGIDPGMVMIPAHAWTPWFGIFGSKGGYNSLEECFEDLTPHIFAIETGLSSDPVMNWRCSWLDSIALISNSDAHSLEKLGREANVIQLSSEADTSYDEIMRILREQDEEKFLYTIEFYPEEGKYHLDGHAPCLFFCTPEDCVKYGGKCPKCKKSLTIGVMHRVADLADRTHEQAQNAQRIPYKNLVPLSEILADTFDVGVAAKKVQHAYQTLTNMLGSEFSILLHTPLDEIARVASPKVAQAIERVRSGNIVVQPGYDGIFGRVKVFAENEPRGLMQHQLFFDQT